MKESMDCTTERTYFSQSMEWGSSQNFTLQPVNPWKKSMNRTGPNMGSVPAAIPTRIIPNLGVFDGVGFAAP